MLFNNCILSPLHILGISNYLSGLYFYFDFTVVSESIMIIFLLIFLVLIVMLTINFNILPSFCFVFMCKHSDYLQIIVILFILLKSIYLFIYLYCLVSLANTSSKRLRTSENLHLYLILNIPKKFCLYFSTRMIMDIINQIKII